MAFVHRLEAGGEGTGLAGVTELQMGGTFKTFAGHASQMSYSASSYTGQAIGNFTTHGNDGNAHDLTFCASTAKLILFRQPMMFY